MAIAPDKLKALGKAKGMEAPKPKTLMMGKVEDKPAAPAKGAAKPADDSKALAKHAPTIASVIEDKAEGKFSIKDKPTAADVSLAQAVYDALPSKAKEALAPLADISLSRAIVLADELADNGVIDDPEPMTAFLFLAGQIIPKAAPADEGDDADEED